MKLDKLIMIIGGVVLFIIFIFGMITNYNSLYEPELTKMSIILSGTLVTSICFINYGMKDGLK